MTKTKTDTEVRELDKIVDEGTVRYACLVAIANLATLAGESMNSETAELYARSVRHLAAAFDVI